MPDLAPFFAFLAATAIGLGMSIAAFIFARKSGLASIQSSLVLTLKDNAAALESRVDLLDDQVEKLQTQKIVLETTVERLRNAIADLAAENAELRRKLHLPASRIEIP